MPLLLHESVYLFAIESQQAMISKPKPFSLSMTEPLIKNVSDTAFWIAHHRALETERTDALFRDPLAARLAGQRGRKIAAAMPNSLIIGWSVVIRTCIIDDFIPCAGLPGPR